MARDTRAATAAKGVATIADHAPTPHKRKRRTSASPAPTVATPVKLVLPSPLSVAQSAGTPIIKISPLKVNGEVEHEPKRQRISLKVSPNGLRKSPVPEEKDVIELEELPLEEVDGAPSPSRDVRTLSKEIRGALALIISQMATGLPPPLNGVLTLWLPPDFAQRDENTLAYVLRQEDLTWDTLVEILHEFCANLLVPCSYPNPMPSLAQCHFPIPPLPSQFPPHIIYNFCASLHTLILQVEPQSERLDGPSGERWALMQKTPANGQAGLIGGDWFTTMVDMRAAESEESRSHPEKGLLETLATDGGKFGHAIPINLGTTTASSSTEPPKLSDTLIRRASLKMQRWKEQRAIKRAGGFGAIVRGVTIPVLATTSFTPSFAPTFDSSSSTGAGYYATLQAMHERAKHKEWSRRVLRRSGSGNTEREREGWWGTLDSEEKGKGRAVDDVLSENAGLLEELHAWQEVRLRKGDEAWIPKRELLIAEALSTSLTVLADNVPPSKLLNNVKPGLAHDLAKRFIPVGSPLLRGMLDPRRPHALHDNTTARMRSQAIKPPVDLLSPHAPPPARVGAHMAPPPLPNPPPPHILPRQPPPPSRSSAQPYQPSTPRPSASTYNPYTPNPMGNSTFGRTNPNPVTAPTRPGPGPSTLRQSFGPTPGIKPAPVGTVLGAVNPVAPPYKGFNGTSSRV